MVERNYNDILISIRQDVKNYLTRHRIKSLVIGVSGGMDSGLNSAILSDVCKELEIPLIGRYIHIESNKEDERQRAFNIGECFCTDMKEVDLTDLYNVSLDVIEEDYNGVNVTFEDKIRRGNVKARLRMIYLYNLAQATKGIVVDNDNLTEHQLGFWTLNGDVGDITPLAYLWKSEVYDFAKYLVNVLESDEQRNALQLCIDAVPTDGLGITSSDLEQIGTKNYYDTDKILDLYINHRDQWEGKEGYDLIQEFGLDVINKVTIRHNKSKFKRNNPYKINL